MKGCSVMAALHETTAALVLREDAAREQFRREQVFKGCTEVLAHNGNRSSRRERERRDPPPLLQKLAHSRSLGLSLEIRPLLTPPKSAALN